MNERGAQHQAEHVPSISTERHADADLVGSPCYAVSCYAVQSDAGQYECQHAEQLRKPRDESFLIKVASHLLAKTHHVEDGEIRIGIGKRFADSRLDILRSAGNMQLDGTDPSTKGLSRWRLE